MKILSAFIIIVNTAFASFPTDLALLKKAVAGALVNYTLKAGVEKLAIQNETLSEENWLIRDALLDKFQGQGVEIFSGIRPDTAAYELTYRVTELGVYYQHRFKKFPWSPSYIKRLARAELELVLMKNNQVLETKNLDGEYTDAVPERDLSLLRSKQFTHDETITDSPNIWEPLLVVLVVGALVLAFYSPKTF
jgi:hypothetical protein